jgi:ATP-dependent Clp protease protease subunit
MKAMEEKDLFIETLIKKREIYLDEDITNITANRIGRIILFLNAQSRSRGINLYINSNGGSVTAGFDLYDIIKHSKAPVTGIVFRGANSMATIVLQACLKRQAMAHSTFSFHYLRFSVNREWDELEMVVRDGIVEIKKDQEKFFKILIDRSGGYSKEIRNLCREKKIISAQEAKEINLIDEIV